MSAESWPTEDLATKAVDAAARYVYNSLPMAAGIDWADVPATVKLQVREQVLPLIWAALNGLPDPRYAAFEEGAASVDYDVNALALERTRPNPYPSGI